MEISMKSLAVPPLFLMYLQILGGAWPRIEIFETEWNSFQVCWTLFAENIQKFCW